jgi:hypothetical protein
VTAVRFDAVCTNCLHWWRAVLEEEADDAHLRFGLECSHCGEQRGRIDGPVRRHATLADACAAADAEHQADRTPEPPTSAS